mmetsp:Transcript_21678/g.43022  ORF Transcript_21678/g.43022 Transcript_21678/m.43022 type:complete len:224 (+) Transcript_21678:1029-1700(+)
MFQFLLESGFSGFGVAVWPGAGDHFLNANGGAKSGRSGSTVEVVRSKMKSFVLLPLFSEKELMASSRGVKLSAETTPVSKIVSTLFPSPTVRFLPWCCMKLCFLHFLRAGQSSISPDRRTALLPKNSCSNSLLVMQSAWFGLVHISLRGIVQGKEAASLLGGPSHPLLSEDGLEYPGENELDLAPDGRFLVEVLRSVDVAGGAGLWLRGAETDEVRWVTVEKW